jgi:hypothetical protein
MPHTRTIETTLAAWSLVAGLAANFAGFMLIGRLAWPVSVVLVALGTSGLVGTMLLVAYADRKRRTQAPEPLP